MLLQEPQLCKDWIPTMKLQTQLFFPYPDARVVDRCGCLWEYVGRAGLPRRCVQKDHPPLLQEPKALLRFESWPRGIFGQESFGHCGYGSYLVLVFCIQAPIVMSCSQSFFPCVSALRNWVPYNFSMLIFWGCKPNHGSWNWISANLRCSAILHWS